MENKHIPLDFKSNTLFVRILQVIFGFACLAVAIFWIVFNMKSVQTDISLWITTLLLIAFGLYQVLSGFGKTRRFININGNDIILKKNALLPGSKFDNIDIKKIELFPLNIIFYMKNGRKTILRFGINYPEVINIVKDALKEFSELNNIEFDITNDPD
ncbi:MAG: hypothetical protein GT600_08315 [Bacteroidales bacterium]|jgi:hypothetical protein|nr:hypothetical protein [Bacteroidales bacterium]OQB64862.1 MAG: hypothetical protein BWX96_00358 [Bacteroidetes bacterium ADurb.Bin145]HOU02032.1 hypothetical protein [Bacteroidales bacterium]HQK66820.1 hypothetical protein [Bacteroidales bacterium]